MVYLEDEGESLGVTSFDRNWLTFGDASSSVVHLENLHSLSKRFSGITS